MIKPITSFIINSPESNSDENKFKVIAINGSPRKDDTPENPANTHKLLVSALEGAKRAGAETKIFNLYDIVTWQGCKSCFVCKENKSSNDICVMNDDLKLILEEISDCDALILGSPIYLGNVSGAMRSFFERLIFPHIDYSGKQRRKGLKTLSIYTMNRSHESAHDGGYDVIFNNNKKFLERVFDTSAYYVIPETYQWNYKKYSCKKFDGRQRIKRRNEVFPQECAKAYMLGRDLVKSVARERLAIK